MQGNVVFIVGNEGSGKSYLVNQLPNTLILLNLTPSGVDKYIRKDEMNIALELNCFPKYSLRWLNTTVGRLIRQGKHVYLMCNLIIFEKINSDIFLMIEEVKKR